MSPHNKTKLYNLCIFLFLLVLLSRILFLRQENCFRTDYISNPGEVRNNGKRELRNIETSPPNGNVEVNSQDSRRQQPLIVIYRDISMCLKPKYLTDYKAHCWAKCKDGGNCEPNLSTIDIDDGKANLRCFENYHLIGVRKCGTTDISHNWFLNAALKNKWGTHGFHSGDYYSNSELCPVEYFESLYEVPESPYTRNFQMDPNNVKVTKADKLFHYGPGTLLGSSKSYKNKTHMIVSSGVQYLGFMATSETKLHISLRNPTDRAISYLFHWHKGKLIFPGITHEQFCGKFTHYLLLGLLEELKSCIHDNGELGCIYQTEGYDGDLRSLLRHSLYVIYIEEAVKFIPLTQIIVTTMEEYGASQEKTIADVMKHFKLPFEKFDRREDVKVVLNKGLKNTVSDSVIRALDDFYSPYNQRLANLLSDNKYLFMRI